MKKQVNAIYCIMLMLTVWCMCNSAKNNKVLSFANEVYSETQLAIRETSYLIDRVNSLELAEPQIIIKEVIKEVEIPVLFPNKEEEEE